MVDEALREEIIHAQDSRTKLLKWKLILTAALGAAALGLAKDSRGEPLLLALIPLVCGYVDALCYHVHIRNVVIGQFQRLFTRPEDHASFARYEAFIAALTNVPRDMCTRCMQRQQQLAGQELGDSLQRQSIEDWNRLFSGTCIFMPRRCPMFRQFRSKRRRALADQWGDFIRGRGRQFAAKHGLKLECPGCGEVASQVKHSDTESVFQFENLVLEWSTYFICGLVLVWGVLMLIWAVLNLLGRIFHWSFAESPVGLGSSLLLVLSALGGGLLSFSVNRRFQEIYDAIWYVAVHMPLDNPDTQARIIRFPSLETVIPFQAPDQKRRDSQAAAG